MENIVKEGQQIKKELQEITKKMEEISPDDLKVMVK